MDSQLKSMLALQEKQLRDALAQFFDPTSGEVTRRLKDFVDDRGELARFLEKHVGVGEQHAGAGARPAGWARTVSSSRS